MPDMFIKTHVRL